MSTPAFAATVQSLGRAGLFSLSVLRASLPTRDFFAELTREIYKIGGRYDAEISNIVRHLEAAIPFATEPMAIALRALIQWYRTGDDADRAKLARMSWEYLENDKDAIPPVVDHWPKALEKHVKGLV